MKKKIWVKVLSLMLACSFLVTASVINSSASQEINTNSEVTLYDGNTQFRDCLIRASYFGLLYYGGYGTYAKDPLVSLKYKALSNSSGAACSSYTGNFLYKTNVTKVESEISIICGNKMFWSNVVNNSDFNKEVVKDFGLLLGKIILSLFGDDINVDLSLQPEQFDIGARMLLKDKVKEMGNDDVLALIPEFTIYTRYLYIIRQNLDLPTTMYYFNELDIEAIPKSDHPTWVNNGPAVTIL